MYLSGRVLEEGRAKMPLDFLRQSFGLSPEQQKLVSDNSLDSRTDSGHAFSARVRIYHTLKGDTGSSHATPDLEIFSIDI
jgi:hypothetical protein